jgi:hypothetical protein
LTKNWFLDLPILRDKNYQQLNGRIRSFTVLSWYCKTFIDDAHALFRDSDYIIENKQSDAVTIAKRNLSWQEIAKKLNAQSQIGKRSAKQIHALDDNLKKTARSNLHSDKVSKHFYVHMIGR